MSPYSPDLLPDGSIRLLRLMPHRDQDAPIRRQLVDFPLQESAKGTHAYKALSYVWGSPEKARRISVGAHDLTVAANLHIARVVKFSPWRGYTPRQPAWLFGSGRQRPISTRHWKIFELLLRSSPSGPEQEKRFCNQSSRYLNARGSSVYG